MGGPKKFYFCQDVACYTWLHHWKISPLRDFTIKGKTIREKPVKISENSTRFVPTNFTKKLVLSWLFWLFLACRRSFRFNQNLFAYEHVYCLKIALCPYYSISMALLSSLVLASRCVLFGVTSCLFWRTLSIGIVSRWKHEGLIDTSLDTSKSVIHKTQRELQPVGFWQSFSSANNYLRDKGLHIEKVIDYTP